MPPTKKARSEVTKTATRTGIQQQKWRDISGGGKVRDGAEEKRYVVLIGGTRAVQDIDRNRGYVTHRRATPQDMPFASTKSASHNSISVTALPVILDCSLRYDFHQSRPRFQGLA